MRRTLIAALAVLCIAGPAHAADSFTAPLRFVFGQLTCAVNVNLALAEKGIRGTGSALAKSFLNWGRPSAPVPGAVAVYHRGRDKRQGHVAIVSRVFGRKVLVWNPSRSGWREIAYPRRAITYRVASRQVLPARTDNIVLRDTP
jgi:hypothetical protein